MSAARAFIDTNLLVLLVVGSVDRNQVGKLKRVKEFSPEDYDLLVGFIDGLDQVFITPNTLTETSNLLERIQDVRLMRHLSFLVQESIEVYVESKSVVNLQHFGRLGLTDSVLLESISEACPLVTVDSDLFRAALSKGDRFAYNFTHWRF